MKWRVLTLGGVIIGAILLARPVRAASPVLIPSRPIGVPLTFAVTTSTPIHIKTCFSFVARPETDHDPANLDCQGDTWNGTVWLGQDASWADLPHATPQSGQIRTVVGVRILDPLPPYLYFIWLADGKTSSSRQKAALTFLTEAVFGDRRLEVITWNGTTPRSAGWITTQSGATTEWWPVVSGTATAVLAGNEARVAYHQTVDSTDEWPTLVVLPMRGNYRQALNPPPSNTVSLSIRGPSQLWLGQAATWQATVSPADNPVSWYLDGILQANSNHELVVDELGLGHHVVEAQSGSVRQQISVDVSTYPYLRLIAVVPRPDGSDGERVSLKNRGPATLDVSKWLIRSNQSSRTFKLSGLISPGQTTEFTPKAFFVNRGGSYDLVDPSGAIVDRLIYPAADVADTFVRDPQSIVWRSTDTPDSVETVTLTGRVDRRAGKSLDMVTTAGRAIHLIIQNTHLPPLHKGAVIRIDGARKQIVRGREIWRIVETTRVIIFQEASTKPRRPSRSAVSSLGLVAVAHAHAAVAPPRSPPLLAESTSQPISLVLAAVMLALGCVLVVPRRV